MISADTITASADATRSDPEPDRPESRACATDEATAARKARNLDLLQEVAEAGAVIAGVLKRQIVALEDAATDSAEPAAAKAAGEATRPLALAFDRVARSVRLTLVLQAVFVEGGPLQGRKRAAATAPEPGEAARRRAEAKAEAAEARAVAAEADAEAEKARAEAEERALRQQQVRDMVLMALQSDAPESEIEDFWHETQDRLDDEEDWDRYDPERSTWSIAAEFTRDLDFGSIFFDDPYKPEGYVDPLAGKPVNPRYAWRWYRAADADPAESGRSGPDPKPLPSRSGTESGTDPP